MDQVVAAFLIVLVVALALLFVFRRGSWRSFEKEWRRVRQDLLEKSAHPNCGPYAQIVSAIIGMLDCLANAGDKTVRGAIPGRRWSRLLEYPQWLDEILTAVGKQGFTSPYAKQLEGLERGVSSIHQLVFTSDEGETS